MIRFIGDTHAKWEAYLPLTEGVDSVQVGDFGAGFREIPALSPRARFIRGNHDNPEVCRNHPNWIPDGTLENGIMYIGGAYSIDRAWRTVGVDWWEDEEIAYTEWDAIISKVEQEKPRVIVTHDCPNSVVSTLFPQALPIVSKTQQALDVVFGVHKPDLFIFGHWHYDRNKVINGTRFICLNELHYVDVDLSTLDLRFGSNFRPG